jgi:hypothetical protein
MRRFMTRLCFYQRNAPEPVMPSRIAALDHVNSRPGDFKR